MPKKKKERLNPSEMKASIKTDDKYRRFRRIVKSIGEQLNIDKLSEEIKRLHSGRKSRTLYLKRPSVDTVVESALQDSAYRSRIAEIWVEADYFHGMLEEAITGIRKHFMSEFHEQMDGLRTKGERMGFADQYLNSGLSLMSKLDRLTSMAGMIIKDIDQTGFTFKHVVDSLDVLYSHKNDKKNV
jgi:hypothetical protein